MPNADLGANEFLFTGDRTQITFFPQTPGPLTPEKVGGELQYQGPEGERTFFGQQITRLDTSLGTLLTVVLEPNADAGAISITVVVPQVFGVTRQQPLTFGTVAVKTTGRGFTTAPGVALTYDLLPLGGDATDCRYAHAGRGCRPLPRVPRRVPHGSARGLVARRRRARGARTGSAAGGGRRRGRRQRRARDWAPTGLHRRPLRGGGTSAGAGFLYPRWRVAAASFSFSSSAVAWWAGPGKSEPGAT